MAKFYRSGAEHSILPYSIAQSLLTQSREYWVSPLWFIERTPTTSNRPMVYLISMLRIIKYGDKPQLEGTDKDIYHWDKWERRPAPLTRPTGTRIGDVLPKLKADGKPILQVAKTAPLPQLNMFA